MSEQAYNSLKTEHIEEERKVIPFFPLIIFLVSILYAKQQERVGCT